MLLKRRLRPPFFILRAAGDGGMARAIPLVGRQIFHRFFDTPTLKRKIATPSVRKTRRPEDHVDQRRSFFGGSTSDQQIIQELVTSGKLIVD
jgi:hypothetical protein